MIRMILLEALVLILVLFAFWLSAQLFIGGSKWLFGTSVYGGFALMVLWAYIGIKCYKKGEQ